MITLILTQGNDSRPLHFEQELVTIGRSKDSILKIVDKKVSREHAKIERIGATFQISDLESGNGTKVNGKKIDFHVLADGDEIMIGDAHLLVRAIDGDSEDEAKAPGGEVDLLPEAGVSTDEVTDVREVPPAAKRAAKA